MNWHYDSWDGPQNPGTNRYVSGVSGMGLIGCRLLLSQGAGQTYHPAL